MPSVINPRRVFPVYAAASPPTVDVGMFTVGLTGVDLKNAATVTIFTVPTGRTYVLTGFVIQVTAVNTGGAGTENVQFKESSGARLMSTAYAFASQTPVANQTIYVVSPESTPGSRSNCGAGNSVQMVVSTSHAGSTGVTGTVYVTGFYVT